MPEDKEFKEQLRKLSARRYYQRLIQAKEEGRPIAVSVVQAPVEIYYAMGVFPIFPESMAAISSGIRKADEFYELTSSLGYSKDICSYTRCGLGLCLKSECAFGPLPKPDFIVTDTNLCCLHAVWWEILQKHYGVPLYVVDAPHIGEEVEQHHVDYYIEQMKGFIRFIEETTGARFDEGRLREAVSHSDRAAAHWEEIHRLRKNIPSPISFRDLAGYIFPLVVAPGTPEAAEYYGVILNEVRRRTENGHGVAQEEKHRLIWDNIPMWHNLPLINFFEERGAVFVYESYTNNIWGGRLDPDRPFESLAEKYLTVWVNYPLEKRIKIYEGVVESYGINGMVLFSNRSCRPNSMGQREIARVMKEKFGIPSLILEGDMGDPEAYSEAQTKARVEAFLELLARDDVN